MKKNQRRDILVYAHWMGIKTPLLMGTLHAESSRGSEIFSFEYDSEFLKSPSAQALDPELHLFEGPQYPRGEKQNFGLFLDSSPDRWGRLLMRRREAVFARAEERKEKFLFESDYLLGVFDGTRMGALRFKTESDGPFLDSNERLAAPPWTSLRELEHASLQLEKDDISKDKDYAKWLNMLVVPGSSLGGARPKASVTDPKNNLWIAKFPSRFDQKNSAAWEMTVHELALQSGIRIAEAKLMKISGRHATYLTKRFDRGAKGQRIHFASAMTMLGYNDGDDNHSGASYLEIAEFLMRYGAKVNADMEELWRRIVFNISITNTDDHLRNHGFLLTPMGWVLSPAYDLNPNETGNGLKLNISENDNALDFDLALEVAPWFRIEPKRAKAILKKVTTSVKTWRKIARKNGISHNEQDQMERAFRGI